MHGDSRRGGQGEECQGGSGAQAAFQLSCGALPQGLYCPHRTSPRGRVTSLALPKLPSCPWRAAWPRPLERLLWDIQQETGA